MKIFAILCTETVRVKETDNELYKKDEEASGRKSMRIFAKHVING